MRGSLLVAWALPGPAPNPALGGGGPSASRRLASLAAATLRYRHRPHRQGGASAPTGTPLPSLYSTRLVGADRTDPSNPTGSLTPPEMAPSLAAVEARQRHRANGVTLQAQWRGFSQSLHVGWQTRPRSRTLSPFSRLLSLSGARHSVTAGTHGSTLTGYYIATSCRGADDVCQRLATSSWKLLAP